LQKFSRIDAGGREMIELKTVHLQCTECKNKKTIKTRKETHPGVMFMCWDCRRFTMAQLPEKSSVDSVGG
jgi:hypothetical protein